ncbi:MAG: phage portal protein [Candidatus Gastranaerophilales bacterium]|nr:phage portal protein [Candidatus Gastranaerophilales bacterium]
MAKIGNQEVDVLEFTRALIENANDNIKIKDMIEAEKYFAVQNTEIQNKKREYSDGKGGKKENKQVSNVKLANAFYRKAVNQKVNYCFGKPPVISLEPIEANYENEQEEEIYQAEWENLFNAKNRKIIKKLIQNAINCGIGFIYPYIDQKQEFNLMGVNSTTIFPYWEDESHDELLALARTYTVEVFTDNKFEQVDKAELWTPEEVHYFKYKDGILKFERTEKHMDMDSWNKIPFIALKGSEDEKPLLNIVKSYVDAYDRLNSESVDTLRDDLDTLVVLKNYSSETGKLIDAYTNMKEIKMVAVDSDGGVSLVKNDPNISSIQTKLENIKKDIEEFTSTVNIKDIQLGNNPSGVAIKSAFQDTDTYINDLEMEFELFIEKLKYFYDKYLDWTKKVSADISSKYKVVVTMDRDMMINETELIENATKLQGLVSQETLDNYNPAVESHAIEQARREAEEEKNATEENPFDFPTNNENIEEIEVTEETEANVE